MIKYQNSHFVVSYRRVAEMCSVVRFTYLKKWTCLQIDISIYSQIGTPRHSCFQLCVRKISQLPIAEVSLKIMCKIDQLCKMALLRRRKRVRGNRFRIRRRRYLHLMVNVLMNVHPNNECCQLDNLLS